MLLLSAAPASAEEPGSSTWSGWPAQTYDVLVLRPLGLVRLITGASFFVLGAPIVAPFGYVGEIRELYVEEPFELTFRRPLGEFDE